MTLEGSSKVWMVRWCEHNHFFSITVNTEVVAQWIPAKMTAYGVVDPSWVVYHTRGQQPMWIVGGTA
jgi:hypothetical protein